MLSSCLCLFLATTPIVEDCVEVSRSLFSLSKASEKRLQKVATEKEAQLFEDLTKRVHKRFLCRNKEGDSPYVSWDLNSFKISQIPVTTEEEKELTLFLQNRWLSKTVGFSKVWAEWMHPLFDIPIQAHPETEASYARSPIFFLFQTYQKKVENWKNQLPHPQFYPLILTRPFDVQKYVPGYQIRAKEEIRPILQTAKNSKRSPKIILDLTSMLNTWEECKENVLLTCKEEGIDFDDVICIQRVQEQHIGGIRILPLLATSINEVKKKERFLLDWVSTFGLCPSKIELDRAFLQEDEHVVEGTPVEFSDVTKEALLEKIEVVLSKSFSKEKSVMIKGALLPLQGLLKKWQEDSLSDTKTSLIKLSLSNIAKELEVLDEKGSEISFSEIALHVEQIHANIITLLEILSPFSNDDFSAIYQKSLDLPISLKPLVSCRLHTCCMASLAGILQSKDKPLKLLYGRNTYFESVKAIKWVSQAVSISDASEKEFSDADLILAQINPAWKGISEDRDTYEVEDVLLSLHKAFKNRQKPLVLALDSTIDFIFSNKVKSLFEEFTSEILDGKLCIICYRSGIKFDLFGMDTYCGAPFYMVHNGSDAWSFLASLTKDPALQADLLSLNGFCLSYLYASEEMDLYRKYIFENTRALLNKIPSMFHDKTYRVVPFDERADPCFLDIVVKTPFHALKTNALVGGCLSIRCLESKLPVFYRISLGLYHTSLSILTAAKYSTLRLTLGLDPAQVDVLANALSEIEALKTP